MTKQECSSLQHIFQLNTDSTASPYAIKPDEVLHYYSPIEAEIDVNANGDVCTTMTTLTITRRSY